MKWSALFVLMALGASPATQPTTRPTTQSLAASVQAAEADVKQAEAACLAQLRSTLTYAGLKDKADRAMARLKEVRSSGTPQERIAASHDFVMLNEQIKKMEAAAIASDPAVKVALDRVKTATVALEDVESLERNERLTAQAAARAKEANDPILKGVSEGRIILGMSEDQAAQAFSHRTKFNSESGGSYGGRAVSIRASEVPFSVPPTTVFKRSRDDLSPDVQRVRLERYMRYMNGAERLQDQVTVTIEGGKVIQIFDQ